MRSLLDKLTLPADVVSNLEADRILPADVREAALRIARATPDDPEAINERAWTSVMNPAAGQDAYHAGLRLAEAARRAAPWESVCTDTVGLAQYRLGDYEKILVTLTTDHTPVTDARRVILAMAQFRLGRIDHAAAVRLLSPVKKSLAEGRIVDDTPGLRTLVTEAEGLFQGKVPATPRRE